MKLLPKNEYDLIEQLLQNYKYFTEPTSNYLKSMNELITFFDIPIYKEFLTYFYFNRSQYKNRYPNNRAMLNYLCNKLYVQESTLYSIRREIVYKATMLFYKYDVLKEEKGNE